MVELRLKGREPKGNLPLLNSQKKEGREKNFSPTRKDRPCSEPAKRGQECLIRDRGKGLLRSLEGAEWLRLPTSLLPRAGGEKNPNTKENVEFALRVKGSPLGKKLLAKTDGEEGEVYYRRDALPFRFQENLPNNKTEDPASNKQTGGGKFWIKKGD